MLLKCYRLVLVLVLVLVGATMAYIKDHLDSLYSQLCIIYHLGFWYNLVVLVLLMVLALVLVMALMWASYCLRCYYRCEGGCYGDDGVHLLVLQKLVPLLLTLRKKFQLLLAKWKIN